MPFLRYLMICLLCLPLTLFAADAPASKDDLEHAKEVIQLKLDNAQSGLQKDNLAFVGRLDSQDKRIDDIKSRIDLASLFLAGVGIFVGLASIVGFFSVKAKIKEEAQNEAKKEVPIAAQAAAEKWLADNYQELRNAQTKLENALTDFQSKAQTQLDEVAQHASQIKQGMTDHQEDVEREITTLQETINTVKAANRAGASAVFAKPDTSSALQQEAQSLEKTPEAEYKFKEWNARAFAAYQKGDLEGAARYWKQAAKAADTDTTEIQIAQSLYNAGITLHGQNRYEEALASYDQVISRFGNATESTLRELIANALNNKGVALGKLKRNEEAFATYDQAISRFSNATEPDLREVVARAMINKGATWSRLQSYEEAIAIFDQINIRFGNVTEPNLREPIDQALNNKGFTLLCLAKQNWNEESVRTQRLLQAQPLFIQALEHISDKGVVLSNQAYCAHLLGQTEAVRGLLQQALTLGREQLYQGTLGDLAIHPVPADAEYRAILDEVWTQVKAEPS